MSHLRRNFSFILVLIGAFFFVWNLASPLSASSKKKAKTPSLYQNGAVAKTYRPFVILIPSYNNAKYYEKNLRSVFDQDYPNFRVIYTDDASTDGTGEKVANWIAGEDVEEKTTLIRNKIHKTALENHYWAIHACEDEEIIVFLDGDDWLAHDQVLKWVNLCYEDSEIWMTYGNYVFYPNYKVGPDKEIVEEVHRKHTYRSCFEKSFIIPHLRTGYAGLFKRIKLEDLRDKEGFFKCTCDRALMLPAIEMAKKHAKFIKDILYIYNRDNVINDDKVQLSLQQKYRTHIHSLPSYKPIKSWKKENPRTDLVVFSEKGLLEVVNKREDIDQIWMVGGEKSSISKVHEIKNIKEINAPEETSFLVYAGKGPLIEVGEMDSLQLLLEKIKIEDSLKSGGEHQ